MRKIATAILLAAGRGKRLRPHTDTTPKPLLEWRGRPTLDWILDSLQSAGISRVVLVTGHLEEQIKAYADERMAAGNAQKISCVTQSNLDGTAGAVSCALTANPEWFDQSFLVTATDYLVADNFYPELLDFHQKHDADVSVSLKTVPEEELAGRSSVAYSGDYNISEIVEKPPAGTAPSNLSANLIFVFPPALTKLIVQVQPSTRGEKEIQSAVNTYLADGGSARGILQSTPEEWDPGMIKN